MELNVLYQSDNYYAPQTGVSITSLLANNKDIEAINIYLLDDGITEDNLARIKLLVDSFDRKLEIISTTEIKQKLIQLDVVPYKGSYTTYLKLLAVQSIETSNNLILQIDGDTIINESLAGLFEIEIDNYICAATMDCIQNSYKSLVGIRANESYYNCGVLWINQRQWRAENCEARIIEHLQTERNKYFIVDQDIINVLFRDKIKYLDIAYNLNSNFYLFDIDDLYFICDLDESYFAPKDRISTAIEKPIINHCISPMMGRPWELGNHHPQNALYDKYKSISPWNDIPKIEVKKKGLDRVGYYLYKAIPPSLYKHIYKKAAKLNLKRLNRISLSS